MTSLTFNRSEEPTRDVEDPQWLWAAVPLWMAYALIFAGTERASLGHALSDAAANVVPLVALAVLCRSVLPRLVAQRPAHSQAALHALAGLIFSSTWYLALVVLLALIRCIGGSPFHLVGFEGPALTWQLFQGTILYCAIAVIVCRPARLVIVEPSTKPFERYLIRVGEDFRPIEVAEIVTIRGAEDYSEVSTSCGKHLVRMSLGEFERRLDPEQFIRVHRSAIVHIRQLERLEPAGGGRMLAHMVNGEVLAVSRKGTLLLRSFIV